VKRDDLTCLGTLEPPPPVDGCAFVYILACSDAALYIGSTGDLAARFGQHGGSKGAKFTRDHAGGRLVYYEGPFDFAVALQRER
jgi:predicted GIY-YIG superfamily endonuclease